MATITKAIADYSIAVGHGSSARGKYGVSLGSQSSQMHEGSVSIGYNADAGLILGHSSWTETNESTNGSAWSDITYNTPSEGTYVDIPIFVAVSNGSTTSVMVSDDGENWNAYNTVGSNLSWNAITSAVPSTGTYDDKILFVAVGASGSNNDDRVMTSSNGVTWTKQTSITNSWKDITHGIPREGIYNDTTVFVAVATDGTGNRVMTSDDGESWTGRDTANKDLEWCSITSGVILDDESTEINKTIFVAVSNDPDSLDNINYVLTSLDAINWSMTQVSQSSISICSGVPNTGTYANKTLFVALSESGSVITSINGTTWEPATSSIGSDWTKINSGTINGITVFIAVRNGGSNRIMTSFDGYTWNLETAPDKSYTSVVSGIPGKGTQGTYSGESIFVAISNDGGFEQVATSNFSSKNSLAIGTNATTGGESSVAFGYGATTNNSHNAIAIGKGTIGMADHSIVLGTDASANGLYNIAIGYKAGADINVPNCISIGNNASVTHMNCIAIGQGSKTTSGHSVAIGNDATANYSSMAIGNAAKATDSASCAVGSAAEAIADNTVAVGTSAKATGADSIAIGKGAVVTGSNSIALGRDSTVTADNVICLGNGTQNVGIGITNPVRALDILGSARLEESSGAYLNIGSGTSSGLHHMDYWSPQPFYINYYSQEYGVNNSSDYHGEIRLGYNRMTIRNSGHVGIGTTNPQKTLHVQGGVRIGNYWHIEGSGQDLHFYYNNSSKAFIHYNLVGSTWMNFTGQHRTFIENVLHTDASNNQGLIVCANKNTYMSMSNKLEKGNKAITQNESLPLVSLSTKSNDKSCFGVISDSEDPEQRSDKFGNFVTPYEKEDGDTRIYINSVGEGAVWVSNKNGSLESGDYITTSNIPGYGEKQDSVFLANYTVAKITMDCDFNPQLQPSEIILKQETLDASGNTIYENVLDDNGMLQWTNELDGIGNIVYEYPYNLRYLDLSGNRYSKDDYDTKIANNEEVYIAAYVGCTYHCG